jgi:putative spermidine/putrescine transport system substrate-binding protein
MKITSSKLLVGAAAALLSASVLADTLTVASWGGAYSMSQRKAFYEPFMKETGHVVLEDEWTGELSLIRAMVDTNNYKWDVLDFETGSALAACDAGLLEPIDPQKLGLTADDFLDGAFLECAVGTMVWATVMAYRTDVFPDDPPKNWVDFWNVEKYPGKRALSKLGAYANLEFALMGDGVPREQVYELLRTDEGVDRAFASLDKIKPHVIWWATGAEAPQLLADKEVVMTSGWNGRIYNAVAKENQPFAISWDGQIYDFEYWTIPKGHPNRISPTSSSRLHRAQSVRGTRATTSLMARFARGRRSLRTPTFSRTSRPRPTTWRWD